MPDAEFLPEFPRSFEATRATLHAYALAAGAIPRAYADPQPRWWHASFAVTERGLATSPVPLPSGEALTVELDLRSHQVVAATTGGDLHTITMAGGLTGTELADRLIGIAATYGLAPTYHRERFENDTVRRYDPAAAGTFRVALRNVAGVFEKHRASLSGEVSPVQLWPHGFDLSVEWYGTRMVSRRGDGKEQQVPAQLNLGFYPEGRAYFYSNPWPFEAEQLLDAPLPHGAAWHTEGWKGSILYYDRLQGDPDAAGKLAEYAAAVFEIAAPTLM